LEDYTLVSMKNLQDLVTTDYEIFGPATDLVISLAAVLLVALVINTSLYKDSKDKLQNLQEKDAINQELLRKEQLDIESLQKKIQEKDAKNQELVRKGQLDIESLQKNQTNIIQEIATNFHIEPKRIEENTYGISITGSSQDDIVIQNDATLQRISFGNHILFNEDEDALTSGGSNVLEVVGNVFKSKLDAINEIQIQGHADTKRTRKFSSNLELAAQRAIAVFNFLKESVGIDPTQYLMSATSFGEYKPVQRKSSDLGYDQFKLMDDNSSQEKRMLNRRIEIVLIYRREQ